MSVITIFNVEKTFEDDFSFDSVYSENSLKLSRSVLGLNLSEIEIKWVLGKEIKKGDFIKFYFSETELMGRVFTCEEKEGFYQVKFTYGVDFYQIHTFLPTNSFEFNPYHVSENRVSISIQDKFTVLGSNNTLYSDELCRQAYRKKHYIESFITNENQTWVASPSNWAPMNIRLDDPHIQQDTRVIEFSDDKINQLELYNKDDFSKKAVYYLEEDGTVTNSNWNQWKVRTNQIQFVEPTEWNSIQYASDVLLKQEYNNNVEISTVYPFLGWVGIDGLLGLRCILWHNERSIQTFISEYELYQNKLLIKFGLANSNLVNLLKGE